MWHRTSELIELRDKVMIEGSALLPEKISELWDDKMSSVWLTASDETLTSRIFSESTYEQADTFHKQPIKIFLARTIAFNQKWWPRFKGMAYL